MPTTDLAGGTHGNGAAGIGGGKAGGDGGDGSAGMTITYTVGV